MDFRDYIFFAEVFDTVDQEAAGIELTGSPGSYFTGRFDDSHGDSYKVSFGPKTLHQEDVEVRNAYGISFETGGGSFSLTGKGRAAEVYTKLLQTVKLFVERAKPSGLSFYGAVSGMDVMYNLFINKYLADAPGKDPNFVFFPISKEYLVSKAYIETQPPEIQEKFQKMIEHGREVRRQHDMSVKMEKKEQRERLKMLGRSVGSFLAQHDRLYYVIKIGRDGGTLEAFDCYSKSVDQLWASDIRPDRVLTLSVVLRSPMYKRQLEAALKYLFGEDSTPKECRYCGKATQPGDQSCRNCGESFATSLNWVKRQIPENLWNDLQRIYFKMFPQGVNPRHSEFAGQAFQGIQNTNRTAAFAGSPQERARMYSQHQTSDEDIY